MVSTIIYKLEKTNRLFRFSLNAKGFWEDILKAFLKSEFTHFWLIKEVKYDSKLIKFLSIFISYKRKSNGCLNFSVKTIVILMGKK